MDKIQALNGLKLEFGLVHIKDATRSQCECKPKMKAEPSSNLNSKNVPCLRHVWREPLIQFWHLKIYMTILWVRLWSQVLSKFEPFDSGSIKVFQIQEPLHHQFHVHTTHSSMLQNFMTNLLEKSPISGFFYHKKCLSTF